MHHYIKPIFIYFLIIFFMYVILLQETGVEGLFGIKGTPNVKKETKKAINYLEDSTTASYNNIKDTATQITEDVIGAVTGILGGALDDLFRSVGSLNSTFRSADQNLSNTSNISANFEKDVANSITNSTIYSATPMAAAKIGGIFGSPVINIPKIPKFKF